MVYQALTLSTGYLFNITETKHIDFGACVWISSQLHIDFYAYYLDNGSPDKDSIYYPIKGIATEDFYTS